MKRWMRSCNSRTIISFNIKTNRPNRRQCQRVRNPNRTKSHPRTESPICKTLTKGSQTRNRNLSLHKKRKTKRPTISPAKQGGNKRKRYLPYPQPTHRTQHLSTENQNHSPSLTQTPGIHFARHALFSDNQEEHLEYQK